MNNFKKYLRFFSEVLLFFCMEWKFAMLKVECCYNHMITFAIEQSRVNGGKTVDVEEFLSEY